MSDFDLLVRGGTVVLPAGPRRADVGIRGERIVAIAEDLAAATAGEVLDATGRLVLPGAIDSHAHLGIYRPHAEDTRSETQAALVGGVTTLLSYFRTGSHYLNKTGPYREILPEVLAQTAGNAWVDYGYHLAIMTAGQLDEVDRLVEDGIASFKFYMFYAGLNLAADSTQASAYTMAENYDLGHLYRLMQRVAAAARRHAATGRVSLSVHAETADVIRTFLDEARRAKGNDLAAWSSARPAMSERMAIGQAAILAERTGCPLNILHISSRDAVDAAREARARFPGLDLRLEATLHHLMLTTDTGGGDLHAKVNPPIRGADDVEALWSEIAAGRVTSVASDHACCPRSLKGTDLWTAQPGFGGTSLLYPVLISEGHHRRGLPLERVADLAAGEPARRFALAPRKGAIAPGADADLAIVDPNAQVRVTAALLQSAQEYTPFEGLTLRGWVTQTVLRGRLAYADGTVRGRPRGEFIRRPVGAAVPA